MREEFKKERMHLEKIILDQNKSIMNNGLNKILKDTLRDDKINKTNATTTKKQNKNNKNTIQSTTTKDEPILKKKRI